MRNTFTFGGVTSSSYGVYISGSGIYDAPAYDYEHIEIPGRSGDLVMNNQRFRNIELIYPAFIMKNFDSNIQSLKARLMSQVGYKRLTDTYNSDEFRMATFEGGINVDPIKNLSAGQFEIKFNCKPQRYLTSGETTTTLTASGSISNPTRFAAKPLIVVTGYGTVKVGSNTITITNNFPSVTIDSELGDCYSGSSNANPYVSFSKNVFPTLAYGSNTITISGNVTKVEITPRWWRL